MSTVKQENCVYRDKLAAKIALVNDESQNRQSRNLLVYLP